MADKPFDINKLRPKDTPEYVTPAWLGSIRFALGKPEIMQAFTEDTGVAWVPARSPIDKLIDEATGADVNFLKAFIRWHNKHVWGPYGNKTRKKKPHQRRKKKK